MPLLFDRCFNAEEAAEHKAAHRLASTADGSLAAKGRPARLSAGDALLRRSRRFARRADGRPRTTGGRMAANGFTHRCFLRGPTLFNRGGRKQAKLAFVR